MKKALLMTVLALALPAITLAQDEPRGPRRGGPPGQDGVGPQGRRPMPPLIAALDKNHDGVIDEEEIKNASEALKSLDKNGDGKLTMDELRPQRPPVGPDGEVAPPPAGPGDSGNKAEGQLQRRGPRPPRE